MLESETGLELLQSNHVSLLKIGTTLAILHIFENTPDINNLLIIYKGMEIVSWISFKNFFLKKVLWLGKNYYIFEK